MTRMRLITLWMLALGLAGNGLFMLLGPESWYHTLPTVRATGPFNAHFVRDIGAAYLVAGGALIWLALGRAGGRPAALAGGAFLALHALVHLWDAAAGRASLAHLAQDFALVILVPALVLALAWPRSPTQR
ncbi:hypothetical protein [Algiphilus aromaticivorans]|uniref:hypothetical protein n=1 Tax=Algiphilus aromaticivorans TaxID=382454 RepID=UPI0005C14A1E|nr:hypothetical protein [Algiphilus aromaticivorans]